MMQKTAEDWLDAEARRLHLPARIKCHVKSDEAIKYFDFSITHNKKNFIVLIAFIATVEPLIFGLAGWYSTQFSSDLFTFGIVGTSIAMPCLALLYHKLDVLCSLKLIIFTDAAVYISSYASGLKVDQAMIKRVRFHVIIPYI